MTDRSIPLATLLTNHAMMLGLMILAFAAPLIASGGLDGRNERPIALAVSFGTGVQVFWLVSSYLLLSPKLKHIEILHAAALVLLHTALSILLFIDRGPATAPALLQYLGPVLIGTVCLYFITVALVADRIARTSLGTIGYAFLAFYWPLTLSLLAPRLREAFRQAAGKRSEVPPPTP